jgi:hypothetical protein
MYFHVTVAVMPGVPDPIHITLDIGDKTALMDLSKTDARELMHFLAEPCGITQNGNTILWFKAGYGRECRFLWSGCMFVLMKVCTPPGIDQKYVVDLVLERDAATCLSKGISNALNADTKTDLINPTDLLAGADKRLDDNLRSVFT